MMKSKPLHPIHHFIFVSICIVEIFSLTGSIPRLELFIKPLIMISIMAYFFTYARWSHRLFIPAVLAFFFSLAGDVLLMFSYKKELFFLMGVAAFLLSHLFYIVTFSIRSLAHKPNKKKFGIAHLLVLFLAILLYGLLFPHLEGFMKIAVLLYTAAITAMVLSALQRNDRVSKSSYRFVLAGALLFMLSDSLLAINRFWIDIPFGNFMVMSTYMPAQYLIFLGLLKQSKTPE
jgi:uncharacterized membrane protein YhhN